MRTENFIVGGSLVPCYETREDCEARIAELERAGYELRRGEATEPLLSARYVVRDGKRRWYVSARYNYYGVYRHCSACQIQKDGPYECAEF